MCRSCSWEIDIRRGVPREKVGGYSKMEEDIIFLCYQGNEAVMVWMKILSLKAGKDRKPHSSSSSCFNSLSEVTGKICS